MHRSKLLSNTGFVYTIRDWPRPAYLALVNRIRSVGEHPFTWAAAAFLVPFLAYLRTLAPTVYGLDSAELTTGAYTLGIVHAPGAPLYLTIGHLFTYLPVGDIGYRLNLMSAVSASLTIVFIYQILWELTHERFIALASAWFLAFSYYIWINAVAAELYAPNMAFIAGLILLALRWRRDGRSWQLYGLSLLFGLGLGVHLSLILIAPGFALLLLRPDRSPFRQPRMMLTAIAFGLLGTSIYLYLPLRYAADPRLNYAKIWAST